MNKNHEENIKINDNLVVHYIENESIANIFINNNEKNLLTKSAELMTFKGLLSSIAFFSQTNNYTIDEEGIVIYADIIEINKNMYLELEDTLEYYDEEFDDILKDFDDCYQLALYYRDNAHNDDIEIASFDLNDLVIDLFAEISDFMNNDLYKEKIHLKKDNNIYSDKQY